MAQTIDGIAEILNTIRSENKGNTEKFEKLLTNMNSKLELISEDDEASDLIKLYITELKNVLEQSHNGITNELSQVQNILAMSVESSKEFIKSGDLEAFRYNVQEELNNYFQALSEQNEKIVQFQTKLNEDINNCKFSSKDNYQNIQGELSSIISSLQKINEKIPLNKLEELCQTSEENFNRISDMNASLSSDILNDIAVVKELVISASKEDAEVLNKHFEKLENDYSKVVTNEDFSNFRVYFAEFLQKILDNANVLNLNSDVVKEQIGTILEKFDSMNTEISDLHTDIKALKDLSSANYVDLLNEISAKLASTSEELKESIINNVSVNTGNIKEAVMPLYEEFKQISEIITQKTDTNLFAVSAGFENIKESCGNLSASFENLKTSFDEGSNSNYNNLSGCIHDVLEKTDELKLMLSGITADYNEKMHSLTDDIISRLDEIKESEVFSRNFDESKEQILAELSNLKAEQNISQQNLKNINEVQSTEFQNLSQNFINLDDKITEVTQGIKNYISELKNPDEEVINKLTDLSSRIENSTDEYGQKINILQDKLTEFAQIVENSAADTEGKIALSLEEISEVKENITNLTDLLKSSQISSDDKKENILSKIETGFKDIIQNIDESNSAFNEGLNDVFKNNLLLIEDKLGSLSDILQGVKSENDDDILKHIDEKISIIKEEFRLINTDIFSAFQDKSDEIFKVFTDVKESIDNLSEVTVGTILHEIKNELQTSFDKISENINSNFEQNNENKIELGEICKDINNKISGIEEGLTENIQNRIELLDITLRTCSKDIENHIEQKINEFISEIKNKNNDDISAFKQEISDELSSLANLQISRSDISEINEEFAGNIKKYISNAANSVIESNDKIAEITELLNAKIDILTESSENDELLISIKDIDENSHNRFDELKNSIDLVNDKVDIIVKSDSSDDLLLSIKDSLDITESGYENLRDKVDKINDKLDIIVLSDNSDENNARFDELTESADKALEKLDGLNETSDKIINSISKGSSDITDILSVLHAKVDVLASDSNDYDLMDEIDDIKDLIFEQRKYFESVSDEKAEAIDKYLRDVLLKLENVDTEKNTEDIKETIINALEALASQITFVEETEDIKDFVEEKTDEINQSLQQVHNQLKQLASSNSDFEYTYTLQDVESDIARLRLAVNNLTGADNFDFSDDIKKIITSIEALENSLTQDQIIELKNDMEKLSEDIVSISSRTNKLLLTSDESSKVLNDGLNNFINLIQKLQDRIEYLDNTELTQRIERKIDNIHAMTVEGSNNDKIFHQVLMYLGEWVDSITENISSISEKVSDVSRLKAQVDSIQDKIFDKDDIINELKEIIPENTEIIENVQRKFEEQDNRINLLENKLDKVISLLEEKDDMMLNRKVDKIEKMISALNVNIEKLTSYVDEE